MNKDLAEYEKDLNELKEQILKEGNTLLTKKDLLERFCEIDKEYKGRHWNLLQILANINILIGVEPCEDCISRAQALSDYADWYGYGYRDNAFYKHLKDMPPATPKQRWIPVSEKLPKEGQRVLVTQIVSERTVVYCTRFPFEKIKEKYITAWMPLPKPYESQESER